PPGSYPLSLHDALPISGAQRDQIEVAQILAHVAPERGRPGDDAGISGDVARADHRHAQPLALAGEPGADNVRRGQIAMERAAQQDRKSTRLNSSHVKIS